MTEWNQILPEKAYSPEEPDESVVALIRRHGKEEGSRILDLACGAGRHVVYAAENGLDVVGADTSSTGLRLTQDRLRKQKLIAALVRCDMNHLPYIDSSFDAVVCTRAIYHQKFEGIKQTVSEINRVLRKNGTALIDFLSKRTYSYGEGVAVEEDTYIEPEGSERGIVHHYVDKQDIQHLFRSFATINITLKEREVDGKLRSRWIAVAQKQSETVRKVNK